MLVNCITLFPDKIQSYFASGIQEKAIRENILQVNCLQLRDFSTNKHHKVDDTVFGGGPGMLLMVEPIYRALESLGENKGHVVMTTPRGEVFNTQKAIELSQKPVLTFISGYYEGIDHRVSEHLVDTELSLGNFVLSSGDLASLAIIDAVSRFLPGFLGSKESLEEESHDVEGYLEYPQYTKPRDFLGWKVPDVLLEGHHAEIKAWRESMRKKNRELYEKRTRESS